MGTDALDPDTDDDGICDGPNSVPPVCIGGPDANPFGIGSDAPVVLVNNTEMTDLYPANNVPDAIWQISPDLPARTNFGCKYRNYQWNSNRSNGQYDLHTVGKYLRAKKR